LTPSLIGPSRAVRMSFFTIRVALLAAGARRPSATGSDLIRPANDLHQFHSSSKFYLTDAVREVIPCHVRHKPPPWPSLASAASIGWRRRPNLARQRPASSGRPSRRRRPITSGLRTLSYSVRAAVLERRAADRPTTWRACRMEKFRVQSFK
jgi:hypothetical protein